MGKLWARHTTHGNALPPPPYARGTCWENSRPTVETARWFALQCIYGRWLDINQASMLASHKLASRLAELELPRALSTTAEALAQELLHRDTWRLERI